MAMQARASTASIDLADSRARSLSPVSSIRVISLSLLRCWCGPPL
jgi:hypothetical protein